MFDDQRYENTLEIHTTMLSSFSFLDSLKNSSLSVDQIQKMMYCKKEPTSKLVFNT